MSTVDYAANSCTKCVVETGRVTVEQDYRCGLRYVALTVFGETVYLTPDQARDLAQKLPAMLKDVAGHIDQVHQMLGREVKS